MSAIPHERVPSLSLEAPDRIIIERDSAPNSPLSFSEEKSRTSLSQSGPRLQPPSNFRALNESRKLLGHVLAQLKGRTLPPSVYDAYSDPSEEASNDNANVFMETVKEVMKPKSRKKDHLESSEDESDDETERLFTTDATYDLIVQLKDVLVMSITHGWHIFDDPSGPGSQSERGGKHSSPFRRSRSNSYVEDAQPRSPSTSRKPRGSDLLSSCISILASVILEDSRFKVAHPKPSRPPNALQAISLDVAQLLLSIHGYDPKIVSEIGFAVIPAFTTFGTEMYVRLLTFFEASVVRGMLNDLSRATGFDIILRDAQDGDAYPAPSIQPGFSVVSIHVDGEEANDSRLLAYTNNVKLLSTDAPFQSLSTYYLSSLVSPLLAAVLEAIDIMPDVQNLVDYRFQRLFYLIIETKPDAYNDVLRIIAYHTPKARRSAVHLLATFWPQAFGHSLVSKAPCIHINEHLASKSSIRRGRHTHSHQFTAWNFAQASGRGSDSSTAQSCHSCNNSIQAFGLLCSYCMCKIHFECYDYPEGNRVIQYSLESDDDVRKVATYRFCPIAHHPSLRVQVQGHLFVPVNLFTICLCLMCHRPLFGSHSQSLACLSCVQFTHRHCLACTPFDKLPPCHSFAVNSRHIDVESEAFRQACLQAFPDILTTSFEELQKKNYDELSILHSELWIQQQMITNGLALGTIGIIQNDRNAAHAKDYKINEFEFHHVLQWCEALIASGTSSVSETSVDYLRENGLLSIKHSPMFDWSHLAYICSIAKLHHADRIAHSTSDFLNVAQADIVVDRSPDHPFEVTSLCHIRETLKHELQIRSDSAAHILLSHLYQLGFFELLHHNVLDFNSSINNIYCIFPLPLAFDASEAVETLVSAIEACLSDLDISVNEAGFVLLIRRFWPNGLTTDYAARRILRSVLRWFLNEDVNLAILLRDYLAQKRPIPGLRLRHEPFSWPLSQVVNLGPSDSLNTGGDYITARRALLSHYVTPWLQALHDQQGAGPYAKLLYDLCTESAGGIETTAFEQAIQPIDQPEIILRSLTRLWQSNVTFTSFEQLFLRWLEDTSLQGPSQPTTQLTKIFPRESEISDRLSRAYDFGASQTHKISNAVDIWASLISIAKSERKVFRRSLTWLLMIARSGVEVPVPVYNQFASLIATFDCSLQDSLVLIKAILSSVWLRSTNRHDMQNVISELHSHFCVNVIDNAETGKDGDSATFIRLSLGACLVLFGCDRNKIIENGLIKQDDIYGLPSRRKLAVRSSIVVDPIIVSPALMNAVGAYMMHNHNEISCMIAKFFNLFFSESPYMEPYEIDNFILRNGKLLATCTWQLYDIQKPDIAGIRTSILLRTVVVDPQAFQEIVQDWLLPGPNWQQRLNATNRLFRVVLEVTSPTFHVEDRQWRSSVVDIFYHFFSVLWTEEKNEVRTAVEVFTSNLLPAHFAAISLCWDEYIARAPISDRVKLITFLIQLRVHFPSWKVLSWQTIFEVFIDDDYERSDVVDASSKMHPASIDGAMSPKRRDDPEMSRLRASVLILSLQMIAGGINIDAFHLLKIKLHLVRIIGFNNVTAVPTYGGQLFYVDFSDISRIADDAYACLHELLLIFDAYRYVDMIPSIMAGIQEHEERPVPTLIGSMFTDIMILLFNSIPDLTALPALTLKTMLESLSLIVHKHDFESKMLRHLQNPLRRAVSLVVDVLAKELGFELRQIALSVIRTFVTRWHGFMGSVIYIALESVTKLLVHPQHSAQDALGSQGISFLETTLTKYSQNGLLINLFKRQLEDDFFIVLRRILYTESKSFVKSKSLREQILRDTLQRAYEIDHQHFQRILDNMQTFIEKVYYQGYGPELMTFVGQQMTNLARRVSEWPSNSIDPTSLLIIPAILVQYNKGNSREILPYVETVVRVTLNRLVVKEKTLLQLLHAVAGIQGKSLASDSIAPFDHLVSVLLEISVEGLRMKARVMPLTLKAVTDALRSHEFQRLCFTSRRPLTLSMLLEPSLFFLQNYPWSDNASENDFLASLAIAKLILQLAEQDPAVVAKLSDYSTDKMPHAGLNIRFWNVLVLTALMEPGNSWCAVIYSQLSNYCSVHRAVLRPHTQAGGLISDGLTADLDHAYVAIKLWLMVAQRMFGSSSDHTHGFFAVWNELWMPFQGVLNVLEEEINAGIPTALSTIVSSSMADLCTFLHSLHSPITIQYAAHLTILQRLQNTDKGDRSTIKLSRALRSASEPPADVPLGILVNQAAKEIVAAEKLRNLETRNAQEGRCTGERSKRERTT